MENNLNHLKLDEKVVLEPINKFLKKLSKKIEKFSRKIEEKTEQNLKFWNMKNILWIAGLVGLIGQSEAGISKKKNTGNGIEMIIKRVRDYSRIISGTKGKNSH